MAPSHTTENIYLFVPNLIGYARVALAVGAFVYVDEPTLCVSMYMLSAFLDVMDGYAARYFNQATVFGAVLDMVTDRCATACLLLVLSKIYPEYALAFQLLIALDISSHWMHMYSSLMSGSSSHKNIGSDSNWFLHLYYTSRLVLFFMCAGNELFFVMLYVVHHFQGPMITLSASIPPISLMHLITLASFPVFAGKQVLSLIQMYGAAQTLVEKDQRDRLVLRNKGKAK